MSLNLQGINFASYISFETILDEETDKSKGILINNVDLEQMAKFLFAMVDPKNDLSKASILQQYQFLSRDQQMLLAHQMIITRYCIHRVLTHLKLYQGGEDTPFWDFQCDQDYYGEEINKITLKKHYADEMANLLGGLMHKKTSERIEYILKLEYGYLIESVQNKQWELTSVPLSMLYFSNKKHYKKCVDELNEDENKAYAESLQKLMLPRGIVVRIDEDKYKVIDGYHRLAGKAFAGRGEEEKEMDELGDEKKALVIYYDRYNLE